MTSSALGQDGRVGSKPAMRGAGNFDPVAELVDAPALEAVAERRAGSSPAGITGVWSNGSSPTLEVGHAGSTPAAPMCGALAETEGSNHAPAVDREAGNCLAQAVTGSVFPDRKDGLALPGLGSPWARLFRGEEERVMTAEERIEKAITQCVGWLRTNEATRQYLVAMVQAAEVDARREALEEARRMLAESATHAHRRLDVEAERYLLGCEKALDVLASRSRP